MEPPEGTGKMGTADKDIGKGGSGQENGGEVLCGGGASSAPFWVQDVSPDPLVGEGPCGVSPTGGTADGGHGTQTSAGQYVGVPNHWSGAGNGGTGGDRGIFCPPPEHRRAIHCDPSYHGLVSSDRAEYGNAPIQAMVGTSRPGYHGDQGGADICGGTGGDGGGENRSRRERESRVGAYDWEILIW